MIVVAITAAVDASGTLNTFYVCDGRFVSSPTDTPPNTFFEGSLIEPGSIGIHTFGDGRTGGTTSLEVGEVVLDNTDGKYDSWINYGFDGRPITIYSGEEGGAFPASFTKVFNGTMESVSTDFDQIVVRMRDKQFLFSTPFLKKKYLGNNVAPNGLEGTPNDIKDQVKPRVFGRVNNATPVLVNASKLIYQVTDGAFTSIRGASDDGVSYNSFLLYANSAALLATAPGASVVGYCPSEGLLRLGSTPAGVFTVSVDQGGTDNGPTAMGSNQTVAQIVKALALEAGLSAGEISAADVTALDAANSYVVGLYITDEMSTQECIDKLINSIGAYCTFDTAGVLRMGILSAPSGTPVVTLDEFDIHEGIERRTPKDNGIPLWRVTADYSRNWTVQTEVAESVDVYSRSFLERAYRSAVAESPPIKNQYILAGDTKFETLILAEAGASAEATRLLNLYKVSRSIYDVPIQLDMFVNSGLKIMDVISLNVNRFSLSGKLLRVIGYRMEIKTNKIILQCWG